MITGRRQASVLLVAGCFFMEYLDGTIVTTSASQIARSLGVGATSVGLVITSYLTTLAVLIPLSGWLSHRFGARRIFIAAIAIFTVASGLCGLSQDLAMLVLARILQGVGGAMMTPVGRTVIMENARKSEIIVLVAYITWPALIAPVVAPLAGALITTYLSWHWIFFINVPIGATAVALALRIIDATPPVPTSRLDWTGLTLTGVGLGLLTYSAHLISDTAVRGWTVAACFTASAVSIASAGRHLWVSRAPMIQLQVLRIATLRISQTSGTVFAMVTDSVPFLLPLMLQDAMGWSSVRSGTLVLVLFAGNVLAKPTTTSMLNRWGFRPTIVISTVGLVATTAALGWVSNSVPVTVIGVFAAGNGAFRSIGFTAYNTLALADVAPRDMADANTLAATTRQLGSALGVAYATIAVGAGRAMAPRLGLGASSVPYLVAFVLVAAIGLFTIVEALFLPRQAGDAVRTGALRHAEE